MMDEEEEEVVVLEELHRHEEECDDDKDIKRNHSVEKESVVISQTHSNNKPHEIALDSRNDVEERNSASNVNNAKENEQTESSKSEVKILKKKSKKNNLEFTRKALPASLPSLAPLKESDIPKISSSSFLAALREEGGIKDPDTLNKKCYETMKVLKANQTLDKYVISDDDAAVLCAIPMLLNGNEDNFSIQKMVESCTEKPPSKLFVMMLTALRKLPRYRGVMYIKSENQKLRTIKKRSIAQPPFCVASKRMNKVIEETNTDSYREVFSIEGRWGYDISDFVVERDEIGRYVPLCPEGLIVIEPWRAFEVVDSGIQWSEENMSVVPLKAIENEFIYEKEIIPNISTHIVKAIREGIDDVSFVKRMLSILTSHPFDTFFKFIHFHSFSRKHYSYLRHISVDDNRTTFRKAGGIECLIECYEKHNELIKEILSCLVRVINFGSASPLIVFRKGFIKTITEITLANINDKKLCFHSSLIIFYVVKSIDISREGARFFSDIEGFELILALLTTYHSNDEICGNIIYVLRKILPYTSIIDIPSDELAKFFDSGIFETIGLIMENSEDEYVLSMCESFLEVILNKKFNEYVNIDAYRDLLIRKMETIHEKFSSLKVSEERNIKLHKKLSTNNEPITYDDILAALYGIGVSGPENIIRACREFVKPRWNRISSKYIHSEEEAILIMSYTYEKEDAPEMSPYKILNRKLWKDDIQDLMDSNKSYLRMLLRALRKLPRTELQALYRGIKKDGKGKYTVGKELLWNGFSSTSISMKVTQDFLTNQETEKICGTLFEIQRMWGYDISDFSKFSGEQEVLLEPMLKFTVKRVNEQDNLTIIVLEPLNQPLILENEIPPGCIQHIMPTLMDNTESKEICAKTCRILCNVYMDDDNSPDNKKMFKEYNGVDLLCELFEKHRDLFIFNALVHVIDPRDESINEEATKSVGIIVSDILSEGATDEQTITVLLDGLISFDHKRLFIFYSTELFKGLVAVIDRFIENRSLCLKSMKVISYLGGIKNEANCNKEGAIDVIVRALKKYIDDPAICEFGCEILFNLFPEDNNEYKKWVVEEGWVEVLLGILNNHNDNENICIYCCCLLDDIIAINKENLKKVVQVNGIGIALGVMDKHPDDYDVCELVCFTLASLVINNLDNQEKVKVMNGIETILRVTNKYVGHYRICFTGCYLLTLVLNANSSLQKYVCEKGCIDTLLNALAIHKDNNDVCATCCRLLAIIFSTNELHSKFCTEDVLDCVQECCETFENSKIILMCFLSLIREEDPKVKDAVTRGVCTKEAYPKCDYGCELDEIGYCPKCCVQQKAFRCFTCDKDEIKYYCETCWRRNHQGHKGEEFFYPMRCATEQHTLDELDFNSSLDLIALIKSIELN